jgi:hypothetical protein
LTTLIFELSYCTGVDHISNAETFSWLKGISWEIQILSMRLKIFFAAELLINGLAQEVSELILGSNFLLLWSLIKVKACTNCHLVGTNWSLIKLNFLLFISFIFNFTFCSWLPANFSNRDGCNARTYYIN